MRHAGPDLELIAYMDELNNWGPIGGATDEFGALNLVTDRTREGRTCPLGAIGHPKDGVRGRLQIVYGLLTSKDGIPVAIEVFHGNTGDPKTVAA